ncbi:MAG: hypothetical protein ACLQGV_02660 [Bryobacteraceae bacterium]
MRNALIPAVLLGSILAAQDRPQLVWEGQVDGVVVLHVRGNQVNEEVREGLPVERRRFHFQATLPESRQQVRLEVVEGRGGVSILQQPRMDNDYTLSVVIEDRQPGSALYSLAFFWEADDSGPPRGRRETAAWSGRVDGEAVVSCHGKTCEAEARSGQPVAGSQFHFSKPLPSRELTVSLEEPQGRGEIRLLEQPRESNGFRARVLIRNPQAGPGDYSFRLAWSPAAPKDAGFEVLRRGAIWSGRVDGRIRVVIEGRTSMSTVLGGAPVADERMEFERALPASDTPNAVVKLLRGRGRVQIVEYPSLSNHYQLIFEIENPAGAPDNYEVELRW